jgi:hypothetical protein
MINALPYLNSREDKYGNESFTIPTNFSKVVNILKAVKQRKEQYGEDDEKDNYDYFAKQLINSVKREFDQAYRHSLQSDSKITFDAEEFFQKYYLNA